MMKILNENEMISPDIIHSCGKTETVTTLTNVQKVTSALDQKKGALDELNDKKQNLTKEIEDARRDLPGGADAILLGIAIIGAIFWISVGEFIVLLLGVALFLLSWAIARLCTKEKRNNTANKLYQEKIVNCNSKLQ